MKKIILLLIAFCLFASDKAFAETAKETAFQRIIRTQTVRCGTYVWPPYFSVDPNTGATSGLVKDFSEAMFKQMGLKVEWIQLTLGYQVQEMKQAKADVICGDVIFSMNAFKELSFASAVRYIPDYLYTRAGKKQQFASFEQINRPETRFTSVDGEWRAGLAKLKFPQITIQSLPNNSDPSQMMMNVITNKADLIITDPMTADKFNAANLVKLEKVNNMPLTAGLIGFSVLKGENDLLAMLNDAVRQSNNLDLFDAPLKLYDPQGVYFLKPANPYVSPKE